MAPAASIRTLRDLDTNSASSSSSFSNTTNKEPGEQGEVVSSQNYKSHTKNVHVAYIPGLHNDNHAKMLLDRIHTEFLPLLQKRGYNVRSISEMCCCGDGLDHNNHGRRGGGGGCKKKKKVAEANVLGYNQTQFRGGGNNNKSHTIHLRLRQPTNHDLFYDYESVAGTMSHELAHCEISAHNSKFYKLMEEIQQQHAVFLAKGIVTDSRGFPVGSNQAYTLGGGGGGRGRGVGGKQQPKTSAHSRNAAAKAAAEREQRQRITGGNPGGGQRLGGTTGAFTQWLRPGEAAGMAAEQRRLQDEMWCKPCEPEIIELLSSDDDDDDDDEDDKGGVAEMDNINGTLLDEDKKLPAKVSSRGEHTANRKTDTNTRAAAANTASSALTTKRVHASSSVARMPPDTSSVVVDLTADSDDDDDGNDIVGKQSNRRRPPKKQQRQASDSVNDQSRKKKWSCRACTYLNAKSALVCSVCGTLDAKADAASARVAQELQREQHIEEVKDQEVARSMRDFGFNIFGSNKQESGTMKHMT